MSLWKYLPLLVEIAEFCGKRIGARRNRKAENSVLIGWFCDHTYPVKPGYWWLIQAAAGEIGLLLCQMAKLTRGRVIGATLAKAKRRSGERLGADKVIVAGHVAFEQRRAVGRVMVLDRSRDRGLLSALPLVVESGLAGH